MLFCNNKGKGFDYIEYGRFFRKAVDACSEDLNNKIAWFLKEIEFLEQEKNICGKQLRKSKIKKKFKITPYMCTLERALEIDCLRGMSNILRLTFNDFKYSDEDNCFYIRYKNEKKECKQDIFRFCILSDVTLRLICVYTILKSLHYNRPLLFSFDLFSILASIEKMKNFLLLLSTTYPDILLFSNSFNHKISRQNFLKGKFYHNFLILNKLNNISIYKLGKHSVMDLLNTIGQNIKIGWCDILLLCSSSTSDFNGFFCEDLASKYNIVLELLKKDVLA